MKVSDALKIARCIDSQSIDLCYRLAHLYVSCLMDDSKLEDESDQVSKSFYIMPRRKSKPEYRFIRKCFSKSLDVQLRWAFKSVCSSLQADEKISEDYYRFRLFACEYIRYLSQAFTLNRRIHMSDSKRILKATFSSVTSMPSSSKRYLMEFPPSILFESGWRLL